MLRIVWHRDNDRNPVVFLDRIEETEKRLAQRVVDELNRQMASWLSIKYSLEQEQ